MPRCPDVKVELSGQDGNAFLVLGRVRRALHNAGYEREAEQFIQEATSGDYEHLLATCMEWVDVQ